MHHRFRYLADPLFLCCLTLYLVNRLVLKPLLPNPFSLFYLNDLILIPFWVPIMLFFQKCIGLRADPSPPPAHEILIPLLVWAYVFEVTAPYSNAFRGLAFGDPWYVFFYVLGAGLAALFWHRPRATGHRKALRAQEP